MRTKAQAKKIAGYSEYLLKVIEVVREMMKEIERQEQERTIALSTQVERRELMFDIVRRIVLMMRDLRLLVKLTA